MIKKFFNLKLIIALKIVAKNPVNLHYLSSKDALK